MPAKASGMVGSRSHMSLMLLFAVHSGLEVSDVDDDVNEDSGAEADRSLARKPGGQATDIKGHRQALRTDCLLRGYTGDWKRILVNIQHKLRIYLAATNAFPDTAEFEFTITEMFKEVQAEENASNSKRFLVQLFIHSCLLMRNTLTGITALIALTDGMKKLVSQQGTDP